VGRGVHLVLDFNCSFISKYYWHYLFQFLLKIMLNLYIMFVYIHMRGVGLLGFIYNVGF
jgi:hypothetical protein